MTTMPNAQISSLADSDITLLTQLFSQFADIIYYKDTNHRLIWCNTPALAALECATLSEATGKLAVELHDSPSNQLIHEFEAEVLKSNTALINHLFESVDKQGNQSCGVISAVPISNEHSQLTGIMGILKRPPKSLEADRDLMENLMRNSPDSIYFKDQESKFIRATNYLAKRLGCEHRNDLVGKSDFDFFDDKHAKPAFDAEQDMIKTGIPVLGLQEKEVMRDGNEAWVLTSKMPLKNVKGEIIGTFGISKDITAQKKAEFELEKTHEQLLLASRQAGMTEVATNVLHNVGNVLNSVSIASSAAFDLLKNLKIKGIEKAALLLKENADTPNFLNEDPKGKQLTDYLLQVSSQLQKDQNSINEELTLLNDYILHIKEILKVQQNYASEVGIVETMGITELVEDAIRMNKDALIRHQVNLVRDFIDQPEITVEKHKVLQILVNLIRNAKYACDDGGRDDKQITMRTQFENDKRINIRIIDNGIGIPEENLTKIFQHGFTTRKEGHGFGLHSCANMAKEIGGSLLADSDGPGHGAIFTLQLPLQPPKKKK